MSGEGTKFILYNKPHLVQCALPGNCPIIFCLQLKVVFKPVAQGTSGSHHFPQDLPCVYEVYLLIKFYLFFLLIIYVLVHRLQPRTQKQRDKLFFLLCNSKCFLLLLIKLICILGPSKQRPALLSSPHHKPKPKSTCTYRKHLSRILHTNQLRFSQSASSPYPKIWDLFALERNSQPPGQSSPGSCCLFSHSKTRFLPKTFRKSAPLLVRCCTPPAHELFSLK